jgi:transcriptional regulator with XRE-family HTH domain
MHVTHPLGYALRSLRERRGYTQKTLSERSGYGESYLSRIENGHVQPTSPELLNRIANALQLSPAETSEFYKAARASQKIIHIPPGVSVRGYQAVHDFMRAFVKAGDDGLCRIEKFLSEELARESSTQQEAEAGFNKS